MKNLPKIAFLIGLTIGCIISIYSFLQYPIDPMGALFLPFIMLALAIPLGVIGYCIGYIFKATFIEHRYFSIKLIIALIILWPATQVALTTWQIISPSLNHMVMNVSKMNSIQLDATVDQIINQPDSWFVDKTYELGVVVKNPETSAATLEKIVNMNDEQLYQPMSYAFTILFAKKSDTSLMTLIVNHPHVTPEILTKIYLKANQKLKNEITEKIKLLKQNASVPKKQ